MTCETVGTVGNDYVGPVLPLDHLERSPATAQLGNLLIPARDMESDPALLARYLEVINRPAFGGNVAQYRQWILEMDGVGAVQVYPVWNGGGTVKVSVIGADWMPASHTLLEEVQTALDPEGNQGVGLGLAPIGHRVTVATPSEVPVRIEAGLTLGYGVSLGQVEEDIRNHVTAYLLERRQLFGASSDTNEYTVNIYRARISAAMMEVSGVENVTGLLLNGADEDLLLSQTAQLQQLPVDGGVVLREV